VGLLLANPRGVLHVLAATSQASHDIELLQLQNEEGPCLDCFQNGTAISVADLGQETHRWPRFAPAALDAGFSSVHALPMRLRANILGVMGLFGNTPGALNDDDLSLGQALADVASVSIVQDQAATDRRTLAEQLQNALNSRVLIEQAKGLIAQIGNLDMLQSLAVMQRFARDRHQRLTRVAAAVVSRELSVRVLLDHAEQAGRLQG
jgi:GAF domain-containing protein